MEDEESLERELSCGVCLELYQEPLQLPCMHSFCKNCLEILLKSAGGKRIKCPDCRKTADVGKTGIRALQRNFKLASIVTIYKEAAQKKLSTEKVPPPKPGKTTGIDKKDYEFVKNIVKDSRLEPSAPFEPDMIDELWGTFRRRDPQNGGNWKKRPPLPLPPQPQDIKDGSSNSQRQNSAIPSLNPRPTDRTNVPSENQPHIPLYPVLDSSGNNNVGVAGQQPPPIPPRNISLSASRVKPRGSLSSPPVSEVSPSRYNPRELDDTVHLTIGEVFKQGTDIDPRPPLLRPNVQAGQTRSFTQKHEARVSQKQKQGAPPLPPRQNLPPLNVNRK